MQGRLYFYFAIDHSYIKSNCIRHYTVDPSAGQLIAQFLYQADAAVNTARETREKEKLKNGGVIDVEPESGTK